MNIDTASTEPLDALLAAVASGDGQAFTRLYESTRSRLYAIALRLLKRADWAEDVLQECYVSIWQRAAEFDAARGAAMAWLSGIVRNRSIDWLRKYEDREVSGLDEMVLDNMEADDPPPMVQVEQVRAATALKACFTRLSAAERQIVVLAYYHGLTHSELSNHLRQPLGTVKTRMRRALATLSECFDA